jgi:hypothetical protein
MERERQQLTDHLFGMAVVELALLSAAQVGECMMLQAQACKPSGLSDVCVEYGYLTVQAA